MTSSEYEAFVLSFVKGRVIDWLILLKLKTIQTYFVRSNAAVDSVNYFEKRFLRNIIVWIIVRLKTFESAKRFMHESFLRFLRKEVRLQMLRPEILLVPAVTSLNVALLRVTVLRDAHLRVAVLRAGLLRVAVLSEDQLRVAVLRDDGPTFARFVTTKMRPTVLCKVSQP